MHISEVKPEVIHPTIPSPLIYGYRNKMEFSFTDNRWLTSEELASEEIEKGFALGLHVPGSFARVMYIENCWLQDEVMNSILKFSQDYFHKSGFSVFNLKTHKGLLRFLVIRKSFSRLEYMINVVTFEPAQNILKDYVEKLKENFPRVSSIINTVNRRFAQIARGEEEYLLFGSKIIREKANRTKEEPTPMKKYFLTS